MRMGMSELLVILAIVLLLFGAKRLPELASGLGKAIKNFRRGMDTDDDIDVTPVDKQVTGESGATTLKSETSEAEKIEKGGTGKD